MEQNKIIVFESKEIRRVWYQEEWWFAVVDIIEVLTESIKPRDYWYRLKKREIEGCGVDLSTNCRHLKMQAPDGKIRDTECANTETLFRVIQSIPSPKAEPFKKWLAQVGYERVKEIENPELATERARQYYKALGYDDSWIEIRLRSIDVRSQLTEEWKSRAVKEGLEFSILTSEISKATFGFSPMEYKNLRTSNGKISATICRIWS